MGPAPQNSQHWPNLPLAVQVQEPHDLPQMVKAPEAFDVSRGILTLEPRDAEGALAKRLVCIRTQAFLRFGSCHAGHDIGSDVGAEYALENRPEPGDVVNGVVGVNPEGGVEGVQSLREEVWVRQLQGHEGTLDLEGGTREACV